MSNNLTQTETEILNGSVEIWNEFVGLESQHPSDLTDFMDAIHTIQRIIGMRVLRREHPETFPTYKG